MTWWLLTALSPVATSSTLTVSATTNHPDHLYMAWAYHKPARHPIYRTVRGRTVLCGYKYVWDTPWIAQQTEPGDTLSHTLAISALTPLSTIWYYLFAPDGPYGLEIQGPLLSITLPPAPPWPPSLYVATQAKGIYHTDSFSAPGGPDPVWTRHNDGLHSLAIRQLEPDPLGSHLRHYCIAGPADNQVLYRRQPAAAPDWIPILTTAQASALAGSATGTLSWITTNLNFPGYLYLLFTAPLLTRGFWCIRSTNYGATWTAFQILATTTSYNAGNISAGILAGTSPYAPGLVLYAALNAHTINACRLYASFNNGQTWSRQGMTGTGIQTPRCLVDPTTQDTVYMGAFFGPTAPCELYRSVTHGAAITQVDGAYHCGLQIYPYRGCLWVNPTDHHSLIALQQNRILTTTDFCDTWTDHGPTQHAAGELALHWEDPTQLHLGRVTSQLGPPYGISWHVIFASDDHGVTMDGKAGPHADQSDGGGDSIPWDSGGIARQGMMLLPPP